jgi:hypothetical protein
LAHNLKVVGSNPAPATKLTNLSKWLESDKNTVAQVDQAVETVEDLFVMGHGDDAGLLLDGQLAQRSITSPARAVQRGGRLVGKDDAGRLASARAIATRCASPPDSSAGLTGARWPTSR